MLSHTDMLRVADGCCTNEGTRRRQTYRDLGENKKRKQTREVGTKEPKQENRTGKNKNQVETT